MSKKKDNRKSCKHIIYSVRTFKNTILSFHLTHKRQKHSRWDVMNVDSRTDSGKQSNPQQRWEGWRERGVRDMERNRQREREWGGESSSYPKQSDSCQPANQLSSALTNLDVVLFTSVCALMQIWPSYHVCVCVCVPRPVCLNRLDSVDGSLSGDWQLWHTLCCMEDTCCHSRFGRAPSPADRWAERLRHCCSNTDLHTLTYSHPI